MYIHLYLYTYLQSNFAHTYQTFTNLIILVAFLGHMFCTVISVSVSPNMYKLGCDQAFKPSQGDGSID